MCRNCLNTVINENTLKDGFCEIWRTEEESIR